MSELDHQVAFLIGVLAGIIILAGVGAGFAIRAEQRRREQLERWIRGNLLIIRANCFHASEDAISVVNSLECALPVLARVDAEGLAKRLYQMRRERDARLLRAAREIARQPGKQGGAR